MKLHQRVAILFSVCAVLSAETIPQPGQLAPAFALPMSISSASSLVSNPNITDAEQRHDRIANRLWITSIAAIGVSSAVDAFTSWGARESNGLLAQGNGDFGAQSVGIKAGIAAAAIVPQILLRKHKNLRTPFTIGNFAEVGVFTAASIHNIRVR
ncbi:MAG: hypothetical protein JOZ48_02850 [Acidobacteriaceae bacterium]|nr:hypothetical protein [Acidobacteriaceae bacterium]